MVNKVSLSHLTLWHAACEHAGIAASGGGLAAFTNENAEKPAALLTAW